MAPFSNVDTESIVLAVIYLPFHIANNKLCMHCCEGANKYRIMLAFGLCKYLCTGSKTTDK